jgi:hypothetical protein
VLIVSFSVTGGGTASTTCVDNTSCDLDPDTGTIQLGGVTVNGLVFTGQADISTSPGFPDILNFSVLSVQNPTDVAKTVTAAVSDTGFTGPVSNFAASSSGTFQQATGGTITLNYSDDPANGQGAIIPTDTLELWSPPSQLWRTAMPSVCPTPNPERSRPVAHFP